MSENADTSQPAPEPQKINQGVFMMHIQIAGRTRLCRQFASVLARQVEEAFEEFTMYNGVPAGHLHYNLNLCRWEPVK